jgi:hypothetical protein
MIGTGSIAQRKDSTLPDQALALRSHNPVGICCLVDHGGGESACVVVEERQHDLVDLLVITQSLFEILGSRVCFERTHDL